MYKISNNSLYCSATTKKLLETEQDYTPDPDSILEFCKDDESVVWLRDIVSVIKKNGHPSILRGVMLEITDQKKMRQMIKSLLNYSRVGRDKMELQEISTEKIVKDVLKLNREAIENQCAEISYKNLPKVRASYFSIFQLFYNLNYNAIKYHKEDEKPVVTIIGLETDSHWEFRVTDNGIGIDPCFHDSVFDVLDRLHSRDEFDGTGIGLAVCKKVVDLHGGTIRIESAKGMGTTIHFSISKTTGTEYETD
ncbi:MAG: hypothetical protein JJU13_00075 [Balneolaceae bacterium]|nr:hypothetical protein [Balneolaceae bacterium]